jgi:stage III sporulation protein AE
MIFTVLSNLSTALKFDKFIDFFSSIIKWVIGLIITIFGMFLTVQGISSAIHDGISVKAAKFAISNSIPMIGGFVKDGFDLIVAGSVIIKNTIGFASVIALFYTILSPILLIAVFSLLLKLVSSIIEPVADGVITNFCYAMSKCISYLSVVLITVGLMLFILILLMTMSANASLL